MMEAVEADASAVRKTCQSFAEFVKLAWKVIEPGTPLVWNWHLQAMCDHLEAISRGTLHPRLIINVPPGSSKSTIVTVLWQAYEWGPLGKRHYRYVTTSFELENVKRDTVKTRDLILSDWFQALWPETELKTKGKLSFSNYHTGTRLGVAFASVMGKRGDRLVVDDPHSLKGAESDDVRNETIRLFIEGGLNRTNDAMKSAIVIVMQRVHEEDLSGQLLALDVGFIHLKIPMEFEADDACMTPLKVPDPENPGKKKNWADPRSYEGELMDPVRVPEAAIALQKKAGEYAWNGQYQQRPAPREGGMFKVDKIDTVEFAPWGGRTVRGWDLAASKDRSSAYTAGVKMRRVDGVIYIIDVRRDRLGPAELRTFIRKIVDIDWDEDTRTVQSLPQDPGGAGKVQKFDIAEKLAGRNFVITTEGRGDTKTGRGDKVSRAEPFAAQVNAGMVKFVKGAWNHDYREELRNFPAGKFKDQVDASSRCFGELLSGVDLPENAAPEVIDGSDRPAESMAMAGDDDPWGGDA
jgi:predicted phage terminase large subunit-like protein